MKKELWFDALTVTDEAMELVNDAINRDYVTVLFSEDNYDLAKFTSRIRKAVEISDLNDLDKYEDADIVIVRDLGQAAELLKTGKQVGYHTHVDDRESMEAAAKITLDINYLIVEFKDVTNIPLELIIAKSQYDNIKVLKIVNNVPDAIISMGVMEVGADGVVLRTKSLEDIINLREEVRRQEMGKMNLVSCEIIETKHLEIGERACLDTTSLLTDKEGMIIGCTSSGGLMVCSEVHYLPYMNTRPFRVNAGTISSYVWGPDDIVEYISDLRSGSKVVAVDLKGNSRIVNIARVKTEVRPLILIRAKYGDTEIKSIMQDDWHMRMFSPEGKVINITDLNPGDKVMGYVCEPGRHVGVKISENIHEC